MLKKLKQAFHDTGYDCDFGVKSVPSLFPLSVC